MPDLLEVNGIVLSSMPVGEADRRLLLLTKELGKISAFAKGARKPTSALVGATRPFAFGKFYIYPGRSSYTLHRAEISEYFEPLVTDVSKSAYGCYFMELSAYFTHENADGGDMLALLYYALRALVNEKVPDSLVQRVFEMKTLMLMGYAPDFKYCRKCRKEALEAWFRPSMMEIVCRDCAEDDLGLPLSRSALYTMNHIRENAPNRLFNFTVNETTLKECADVTDVLLNHTLDRSLPAREMLSVLTTP